MKPILFNTEMVRAILAGRKSVTRRVVKPQPLWRKPPIQQEGHIGYWANWDDEKIYKSPYRPGDILYVRETWKQATCDYASGGYGLTDLYLYKADEPVDTTGMMVEEKWRPSIHMPREAARIFLRVTNVRVERLQDITLIGAISEGVEESFMPVFNGCVALYPSQGLNEFWGPEQDQQAEKAVAEAFGSLWDSMLKKKDRALYGWEATPWVWVVEFERISGEEAE